MAKGSISLGIRGIMMILSPAKTLDLSPPSSELLQLAPAPTEPEVHRQTIEIAKAMKHRSDTELGKILSVSKSLQSAAAGYWRDFTVEATDRGDRKPCIFCFSGAAYQGLQATECSSSALSYLQGNLRIIDPVYGVLRPMDLIQPYRLEMGTKKVLDEHKLVDYWKETVTERLSHDLSQHEPAILLNLASDEYSAAVDASSLPTAVSYVKVVFQEEGRVVAVHAKRARGLMARYLAENNVQDLEGVRLFAEGGYELVQSKSDDNCLVFDRKKQVATKRAATTTKTATSKKRSKK